MSRCSVLLTLVLLAASCAHSARRGEPLRDAPRLETPAESRGQIVFMRHCYACHPGGAGGLGPAINDKPLPGFLVHFQVRHGLGAMPSFSEDRISAEDLDDLVSFLKTLRRGAADEAPRPAHDEGVPSD